MTTLETSVADPHWFQSGSGPNPAFYLNADPDPGQTLKSQKVEFLRKNTVLKVGDRSKHIITVHAINLVNSHAPGSGSAFPIPDPDS
jgi:hypothetical protein